MKARLIKIWNGLSESRNLILILSVGLSSLILAALTPTPEGDTWWQLRMGKDLWAGADPFVERWSWTAQGSYHPDHEVIFQWMFYGLWKLGGDSFVLYAFLINILTFLSFLLLVPPRYLRASTGARFTIFTGILLFFSVFSLTNFLNPRPGIISLFFFSLSVNLILRKRYLWLPPVVLLWVQFHGGVSVGVAIIALSFGVNLLYYFLKKTSGKELFQSGLALVLSLGALCASPMGWRFYEYLFSHTISYGATSISEWQPIWEFELNSFVLIVILLFFPLVIYNLRKQLKDKGVVFLLLLWAGCLLMAVLMVRFQAHFILVSFLLLYLGLGRLPAPRGRHYAYGVLSSGLAVLLLGLTLSTTSGMMKLALVNPFSEEFTAVLTSETCLDKTWNDYNSGGYLAWFVPENQISVDSRLDPYPRSVLIAAGMFDKTVSKEEANQTLNSYLEAQDANCYLSSNPEDTRSLEELGLTPLATSGDYTLLLLKDHQIPLD